MSRRLRLSLIGWAGLLAACDGRQGPPGPDGEDVIGGRGPDGEAGERAPSVAAFHPARVFNGREATVLVTGSNTNWTEPADLQFDFGPGITQTSVVVASPTALLVTLDVTPGAVLGFRSVVLTDGDVVSSSSASFAVDPSLEVEPKGVNLQDFESPFQGSVVQGVAHQGDPSTPFDPLLEHLDVTIGGGSSSVVQSASELSLTFFMEIDVYAEPGPRRVRVESGPAGMVTPSVTAHEPINILPRSPTPLALGSNTSAFTVPDASRLYSIAGGGESKLFTFRVAASIPEARADIVVPPESGKFSEALRRSAKSSAAPVTTYAISAVDNQTLFLVYRGYEGASGYDIAIDVEDQPTSEMAPLIEPFSVGSIATAGESAWFTFDGEAGTTVRLEVESDGAEACASAQAPIGIDSELELIDESGVSLAFNDDLGASYCSGIELVLPKTGAYYVRVASSRAFAPMDLFDYQLAFEVL